MLFTSSDRGRDLAMRIAAFMDEHIYPREHEYRQQLDSMESRTRKPPIVDELKALAKAQGLWNLFMQHGVNGLSNLDYAPLAEMMGRVTWASEVFNCSPPDSGNMELLARYGSEEQKARWLQPLMAGEIRSAFSMTEPDVASSDATNLQTTIMRDGDEYVINGKKWFTGGAMADNCTLLVVLGKSDPNHPERHKRHSMILVPKDTPGVKITRDLHVFGYDHYPTGHPEIVYDNVRVPAGNIVLGEGRGFEIAQGRLGPGRIHHCMRAIGQSEVALETMCRRLATRTTFGKILIDNSVWRERIARSRIMIEQARLMVLNAAHVLDTVGNKNARTQIGMIKVICAETNTQIVDWAIQAHGAAGFTEDFNLAHQYAHARALRVVDGPDEVHLDMIGRIEGAKYKAAPPHA